MASFLMGSRSRHEMNGAPPQEVLRLVSRVEDGDRHMNETGGDGATGATVGSYDKETRSPSSRENRSLWLSIRNREVEKGVLH